MEEKEKRVNDFTQEEKIKNFDALAKLYYDKNFGETSKSDIDLLMFKFYLDHIISENKNTDETINYSNCSDYKISQILGITQQRVSNYKVKVQLKYPTEFNWKKAFVKLIENARFEKDTKKIVLNIPDPNLFLEIQNFIEEKGAYIEKQLNRKVLKIRIEYFIDLVFSIEQEAKRKEVVKELQKQIKINSKDENKFSTESIGNMLLSITNNITGTINNILEMISPENFIGNALNNLLKRNF